MAAIETKDLTRVYKSPNSGPDIKALDGVSIKVDYGEVRGLLGPNGAGKTTLTKILSTVLYADSGSATVMGYDVAKETAMVRRQIGVVFGGDRGLNPYLNAEQTLRYWGALYRVEPRVAEARIPRLLERVGLLERAKGVVSTYSRGMKQRLHLARGLIADARVLFLDEPTIGMDPIAARQFRGLVRDLRKEGKTILMTTHDMAEAEALCDRVALIDHGRVLAVETPDSLGRLVSRHERIDFRGGDEDLLTSLRLHRGIDGPKTLEEGAGFRIELRESEAYKGVMHLLVSSGATSIRTSRPSLEEVYLHMIGDRGFAVARRNPG
jgi:ABC-2 type transport system ATP-binding protein